jgi:hypothetical protein
MGESSRDASKPTGRTPLARRAVLPLVSGKTSAALLGVCFLLTALIILPLAKRVPAWIDVEIVLGLWWAIWVVALTAVLKSGQRVSDDHALPPPRNWLGVFNRGGSRPLSSGGSGWSWLDFSFVDAEGCLILLGIILAFVALFAGLWLMIELIIPGLAFVAYLLIRGMLARAANDAHGCEGSLPRALLWGTLWATLYTAPLAILVRVVHLVYAHAHQV